MLNGVLWHGLKLSSRHCFVDGTFFCFNIEQLFCQEPLSLLFSLNRSSRRIGLLSIVPDSCCLMALMMYSSMRRLNISECPISVELLKLSACLIVVKFGKEIKNLSTIFVDLFMAKLGEVTSASRSITISSDTKDNE